MRNGEPLIYTDSGGVELHGRVFRPQGVSEARPAVLVVHEAFGLGAHAAGRAQRLAELGYVGVAIDMFGAGKTFAVLEDAMPALKTVIGAPSLLLDRINAAAAAVRALGDVSKTRLGAIGFCFGGSVVLEWARSGADISGVASFHGTLDPYAPSNAEIRSAILVCHGDADPHVPADSVARLCDELRERKADWQLNVYGGALHGFTNPEADDRGIPGLGYNASADAASWSAMSVFFARVLT